MTEENIVESNKITINKENLPFGWTLDSWKSKKHHQCIQYPESSAKSHANVLKKLRKLPPLVSEVEVDNLRAQLKQVALGKRFLLQGGDCAELFDYCSKDKIESKIKVLLQMSLIILWGARVPIVRIARIAGQYAKPRSSNTEIINDIEYPSFRGENVNGLDLSERTPSPERLLQAYFHSAATLNYMRACLSAGFADLHHPESWNLDHVKSQAIHGEYTEVVRRLKDAMNFMGVIGADQEKSIQSVDLFISHEGLLLDYETQLTRYSKKQNAWYNLGTHFLWIGDRTRQIDGAHVEYFRGIANPIGIKVGPSMETDELIRILDIVNPNYEIGKITLITRYGASMVNKFLPRHIAAVKKTKHQVIWCCDPMHGNTEATKSGQKTRQFTNIYRELESCFIIHKDFNSVLGGVHFELTGDSVTEVTGGTMELTEEDLKINYQSFCDPRLNYEQSMDIAFMIAKHFRLSS